MSVVDEIKAMCPEAESSVSADGIPCLRLTQETLLQVTDQLAERLGYERFIDLTVVDDPQREDRFEIVYLFYSMKAHAWLRLKLRTAERAPSITASHSGASR